MPIRYWYVLVWITYVRSLHSNKSKESAQWTTPELQYLLINYLPVFTVPEKNKKPLARNKRKKYLESRSRGKRKNFFGVKKKEKTNLVLLHEKNQGVLSQWLKENQKTLREYCNAIITKVLNIKQWSQL